MKKLLFCIGLFCTLTINAQTYEIMFAGTGESSSVSSVRIENLMSGESLTLNGSDILRLNIATGVNSIEEDNSAVIKIYPNPATDYAILAIYPPVEGDATVTVSEMTGKPIARVKSYLEDYRQEFRLSGLRSGFYLVSVEGDSYRYSGKLICKSKTESIVRIEKNSFNQAVDHKTSGNESKGTQVPVDMAYTAGDRLKFTGISGNFSTVKTDIPASDKTISFNFITCSDVDNNNYSIVELGAQVWMAENLKTTKYANGDLIGTTIPTSLDLTAEDLPKYQWAYDGIESNVNTFGRLYTWYAVTDSRKICPAGWHAPTDSEWTTLETYLIANGYCFDDPYVTSDGNRLAKALASTTLWTYSPDLNGAIGNPNYPSKRNATGFTAIPSGYRELGGTYNNIFTLSFW
jgi:uncharacterized protein (TIGR02145 family)